MNKTFQQALESARYEVSIELYPNDLHYQIYKPGYGDRDCAWEVYLNPRKEDEHELDIGCETLDEAMSVIENNIKDWQVMSAEAFNELNKASWTVCAACIHTNNFADETCRSCPVTKTVDKQLARRSKR